MSITAFDCDNGCRLVFDGSITFEFARELEDQILSALRRYAHFEVDLSGVREIDLCGAHLLGLLVKVGGKAVDIVAHSPAVAQACGGLLAAYLGMRSNSSPRGTREAVRRAPHSS